MKAMIFAAGLGTRLAPITDRIPKAMVPIDGTPLLQLVADKIHKAGYDSIVINAHHFADLIADYSEELVGKGIHVDISWEKEEALETGGGILHARQFLESCGTFLVHNVDILSNLDIPSARASVRPDALSTLVVSERDSSRYLLFDDDMRLVGWTNVKTGETRSSFIGLDLSHCRRYAFSGIHFMSDKVFSVMDRLGMSGKFSIIDFYLRAAADNGIFGMVPDNFRILDVGKPESLAVAPDFLHSVI